MVGAVSKERKELKSNMIILFIFVFFHVEDMIVLQLLCTILTSNIISSVLFIL